MKHRSIFPQHIHCCLDFYVTGLWRAPRCLEPTNYLPDLTPNKSNLSEFTLNRPRCAGVPHRWNLACVTPSAPPFVACFHPSSATLLCLKSHLFYLRTGLQNWLGLLCKHPWRCVGVAQAQGGELLPIWVIKGIARPDIIAVSKFPPKEYKRKPNVNKADMWKEIFNSNFHIENGNLGFVYICLPRDR